jgi:sugar O-acyltransferase (sialic acid O-acetyltransferase NeuD family)
MSQKKNLVIVGAGAFGREVLWLAQEAREPWNVLGFLDENEKVHGSSVCDLPVLGPPHMWPDLDAHLVIAIGAPRAKKLICEKLKEFGTPKFASLVHSSVQMSQFVSIGAGSLICAGSVLTTQIEIREHVIINLSCTVGHDTVMHDYATLAPMVAASSRVRLGLGAEIGMSAVLLPGVTIGEGAMAGMGAIVTRDIPPNKLYVGAPAKERRDLAPFTAAA